MCDPFVSIRVSLYYFLFPQLDSPQWAKASSLSSLRDHTQTHHTR